jgi:crotonobetainyl-CoA:carnitine CoA-transferase CaiB-like acyl-CoA transferase
VFVVDLSDNVAGRFCAKLLGMGGADVVRPRAAERTASVPFLHAYLSASTRSTTTDPVDTLIADADVVVTSFDSGCFDGDWDETRIRSTNPFAVHVTTSSFGTTGPYRELRGSPLVDWAAGGYLFITGEPDREPLSGPDHLCGYVAGYTAAIAVEAALIRRARTRAGTHLDVSTMESMLAVHQSTFSRLGAGIPRVRTGRRTEVASLVVRPCRDGYVSLGLNTDEEWDRFAVAVDRPELAAELRFADRAARQDEVDALEAALDDAISEFTTDALVALLQEHRIPAARVVSITELLEDPQLATRGFWATADVGGRVGRMPGNPVTARPSAAAQDGRVRASVPGQTPLSGMVVLDFTVYWAGPSATRVLADLGARVIRIERPGSRVDAPPEPTDPMVIVQEVFFHHKMNRNKESVAIDLRTDAGRAVAHDLARHADVVVENFRPGVMDGLGLGPETLTGANPRLVYVSISGFGATGPRAWWGSYGPTLEAASSIEARTGYPNGEPLRLGHTLPDGVGGLAGALAALRGLRMRAATEAGSIFDLSQLEAYCSLSGEEVLEVSLLGRDRPRAGNDSPHVVAQGVYRCVRDDDWLAVTIADAADVERLRAVLDVSTDLRAALHAFAAVRTKEETAAELQSAGLSAFPVVTPDELVRDPHLVARDTFVDVPFAGRVVRLPGSPLRASPPMVRPAGPPPRIGADGRTVLREIVGYDDDQIDALAADGVLVLPASSA